MALSESPTSITISWQPPQEADGSYVVYSITVTAFDNLYPNEEPITVITNETSVVIQSLHPNYRYQCSVSARNSGGLGPSETVIERTLPVGKED